MRKTANRYTFLLGRRIAALNRKGSTSMESEAPVSEVSLSIISRDENIEKNGAKRVK
jgi:hypothetical protein